jgi:hypothetical protein
MCFTLTAFIFLGTSDLLVDVSIFLALISQVRTETVALCSVCDRTLSSVSLFYDLTLPFFIKFIHVAIWKMKIMITAVVRRRN